MNEQITFENKELGEVFISGSKAMQKLQLSKHSFEKVIKEELIIPVYVKEKKSYRESDLLEFMKTDKYQELVNGVVDKRNNLNDFDRKRLVARNKEFFLPKRFRR